MNYSEVFVKDHPRAALFCLLFVSIASFHMFSWEVALVKLEIRAISSESTRKDLTLYLLYKLIYSISKDKVPLQSRMSMKIQVHKQSSLLCIMLAQPLHCKAWRLKNSIGLGIKSIQVLIELIHSAVPSRDSIRIQHRNKDKYEIFT